jgi:hypothetical protein
MVAVVVLGQVVFGQVVGWSFPVSLRVGHGVPRHSKGTETSSMSLRGTVFVPKQSPIRGVGIASAEERRLAMTASF